MAIERFAADGYSATTLRGIAREAGVSPGLVYKYFDGKDAIVLELYGRLSARFAAEALAPGTWTERCVAGIRGSIGTLRPHRSTLVGVLPTLLSDRDGGLLSSRAADSRAVVMGVFERAVADATRAPSEPDVLGRLAYLLQLGVLLWWILDKSPEQRATDGLLSLLDRFGPALGPVLWVPGVMPALRSLDALAEDALYGVDP